MPRPAIDFANGFATLGTAAGLTGAFSPFNPFNDGQSFLLGAFTFEDVGVSAYHGASRLFSTQSNLMAAARLLAVEAYHAAELRTVIQANAASSGITTTRDAANKIATLRGSLGGGMETTLSATGLTSADTANSITFSRSTDQVLHIVYGAAGVGLSKGLFFPAGMNGNIKTTAS